MTIKIAAISIAGMKLHDLVMLVIPFDLYTGIPRMNPEPT